MEEKKGRGFRKASCLFETAAGGVTVCGSMNLGSKDRSDMDWMVVTDGSDGAPL